MILSDPSNKQGIVEDITFLLGSSVTLQNYKTEDRIRNINLRQHDVWFEIWDASPSWRLIASGGDLFLEKNIDEGINTIQLSGAAQTVIGVEILSEGTIGTWSPLRVTTLEAFLGAGGSGLQEDESGPKETTPWGYYLDGDNLVIVGTPNYSKANALRIYVDPSLADFAVSGDESTSPVFSSHFHRLLSIGAALDYAEGHTMPDKVQSLTRKWTGMIASLRRFYATHNKARKPSRIGPGADLMSDLT